MLLSMYRLLKNQSFSLLDIKLTRAKDMKEITFPLSLQRLKLSLLPEHTSPACISQRRENSLNALISQNNICWGTQKFSFDWIFCKGERHINAMLRRFFVFSENKKPNYFRVSSLCISFPPNMRNCMKKISPLSAHF